MSRYRLLPLGVDVGTSRARIAVSERASDGDIRIRAVASRDVAGDVRETPALMAALLEEMLGELGVRERRAIAALGGSGAALRIVQFPKMTRHERLRAARFEAQRFAAPSPGDVSRVVRVHRADDAATRYAVGVATRDAIQERTAILKAAKLKPVALDHDALALRRLLKDVDAVCDIGAERTALHVYGANAVFSYHLQLGGAEVTRGIARELSIDVGSAERRKRILGAAGAGAAVRDAVVGELAALVERGRGRAPISRIALVGNGARLPALASELGSATGALVELIVPALLDCDAYPEDVVRAAAPDWTLAAALTTWRMIA